MASFAAEALKARAMWGADQAGYEQAIRAEIERRWPELARLLVPPVLTDLSMVNRKIVLERIVAVKTEELKWAKVGAFCVPLTERLLRASDTAMSDECLTCWHLSPGSRPKECRLLGTDPASGKARVWRWFSAEGVEAPVRVGTLMLTKAAAMRLEVIAAEQESDLRTAQTKGIPFNRPSGLPHRSARNNAGQFAGSARGAAR